ncbi:SRPBCC family protein [Planomonospora sp. ID82291]|uniref:SRPBCC family protein n=1 Tax=Planomonospora sp. ID82291 TaxID=2738136 RepID=UPI0018C3BE03|nr:SRPBCC family protein [Planomonospora sp. ID82291]MBG0815663.1 SRPBCC family protein [Planomonospora sp. ID82291]
MSEYERSRTMTASPQAVFDKAGDLDLLDSWLPQDLHVRAEEPPAVTVHEDGSGRDERALFRARRDQLRVEWGTRDDSRYAGWLQVAGISDRSSEVTVHLSFFDEETAPPGDEVDHALEKSLERLAEQVRA